MIGDEGGMGGPEDAAGNQQDHLKTDELDDHGGAADADGRAVLAKGIDFQRLSTGSAGRYITIVDSRDGGVDTLPERNGMTLLLQIEVNGQRVGEDIQEPAQQT